MLGGPKFSLRQSAFAFLAVMSVRRVARRDSKLKELNDTLVATRERLDEAVAKLKKVKP